MTAWDRIQRLELELQQLDRRLRSEQQMLTDCANDYRERWLRAVQERDHARDVAVALEQELAARDAGIVIVPVIGEAK